MTKATGDVIDLLTRTIGGANFANAAVLKQDDDLIATCVLATNGSGVVTPVPYSATPTAGSIVVFDAQGGVPATTYAGDPNTFVAGSLGTQCFDTTNKRIYVCTTAGIAASAVWKCVWWESEIKFHRGTVATIPAGWQLCDGTNGLPDLRDKFVIGAKQDDSGAAKTYYTGSLLQSGGARAATTASDGAHTHTGTSDAGGDHAHGGATQSHTLDETQIPSHSHNTYAQLVPDFYPDLGASPGSGATIGSSTASSSYGGGLGHSHNITTSGTHTHAFTTASNGAHTHTVNLDPPFFAICIIGRVA